MHNRINDPAPKTNPNLNSFCGFQTSIEPTGGTNEIPWLKWLLGQLGKGPEPQGPGYICMMSCLHCISRLVHCPHKGTQPPT